MKLKTILSENELWGLTVPELLNTLLKFDGKTLVFFDTETMGLNPHAEEIQLTELAAIAFDGGEFKEIGRFHHKVKLSPKTQQYIQHPPPKKSEKDKSPTDLLKMTRYGESHGKYMEEKTMLQDFANFLNGFPNVIMIAHNARFDMRFIRVRGEQLGVKFKDVKVIDTMKIASYFFVPVLKTIQDQTTLDKLVKPNGRLSVSLGMLAPALEVNIKDWHNAFADVSSMIGVFQTIIKYLESHKDVDIRNAQAKAIKHARWMDRYYHPKK